MTRPSDEQFDAFEDDAVELANASPEERAIDRGLEELLGGHGPPDLLPGVLWRLQRIAERRRRLTLLSPRSRATAVATFSATALTAAAVVAGFLSMWRHQIEAPATPNTRTVRTTVVAGALTWQPASPQLEPAELHAGTSIQLPLQPGDRLQNESLTVPATAQIASLGTLSISPHSGMEIMSIQWKPAIGGAVLGSLVGVVVGGTVFGPSNAAAHSGDPVELTASESPTAAQLAAANLEIETLRRKLDEAREDLGSRAERNRVESRQPENPEQVEDQPPSTEAPDTEGPAFHYPGLGAAVAAIDWDTAGSSAAKMVPMLKELADTLADGNEVPMDLRADIQRLNADLVAMVDPCNSKVSKEWEPTAFSRTPSSPRTLSTQPLRTRAQNSRRSNETRSNA